MFLIEALNLIVLHEAQEVGKESRGTDALYLLFGLRCLIVYNLWRLLGYIDLKIVGLIKCESNRAGNPILLVKDRIGIPLHKDT